MGMESGIESRAVKVVFSQISEVKIREVITIRIDINKNYCITADADQMTVNQKSIITKEDSPNFGKENLTALGYFSTLAQCYRYLLHRQIRLSPANGFKEIMDEVGRIEKELMESIKI